MPDSMIPSSHLPVLHRYYLPGPNSAENLTLIHGWGAESSVWMEWAERLSQEFNVYLIDLPGFGQSPTCKITDNILDCWMQALAAQLPPKTHLLGWSLGGLVAQKLTLTYPERIQSLICLASTPRFTQCDGWNWAVSPPLMADFIRMLGVESSGVLKRFWNLQVQGSPNAKSLLRQLKRHMQDRHLPTYQGLIQGLQLLRDLDLRAELKNLQAPTLWLLGEKDPLIPLKMREGLNHWHPQADQVILPNAGHMPFFSHSDATTDAVVSFVKLHRNAKS